MTEFTIRKKREKVISKSQGKKFLSKIHRAGKKILFFSYYNFNNSYRKDYQSMKKNCPNFGSLRPSSKQLCSEKLSIKISSTEIGSKQNLPFGIFSYFTKLSDAWDLKARWGWLVEEDEIVWSDLEISSNHLSLIYRAFGGSDEDSAVIKGNCKIFNNNPIYYFEVKILNSGREGFIGIGLAHIHCDLDRLPGWEMYSFGYHGDDGHFFDCSGTGKNYGPKFSKGDTIGVCWNLVEKTVFFTKNGRNLPLVFTDYSYFELPPMVPVVGLRTEGESVIANFGEKFFEFDIETYIQNFNKFYMPKIILLGKIKLNKKTKNKEKHFNFIRSDETPFCSEKLIFKIVYDILKKKKIKKVSKFYSFIAKSEKRMLVENMEYMNLKIFFKILFKIIEIFFSSVKSKKSSSQFGYFDSKIENLNDSLKFIPKYSLNFTFKNNYLREFRQNLFRFSRKKFYLVKMCLEYPYNLIYDRSNIIIHEISNFFSSFKESDSLGNMVRIK